MIADCDRLSAFLDGELTYTEAKKIEHALAADPQLCAQFTQLAAADALARQEFAAMLE
ncbi:zf-HC2 domain-containing protein [Yoonia litorea]|uniref:zf-HC2 domain-containing protein n=1 Tax=Yoonia litorea TaxID=1123755 RepID=UPI000DA18FD0|nr:zf-HC2 domain-containing protein [Yoonia litorea]